MHALLLLVKGIKKGYIKTYGCEHPGSGIIAFRYATEHIWDR